MIVDIQDAWPETFHRLIPGKGKLHDCLSRLVLLPWYRLVKHAYTKADAITAVAQTYVDLSGADERGQPSCVVYLGAPFERLDIPIRTESKSGSPFTFVYLGSMSMNYDLETVLRAVALLMHDKQNFKVIFAGAGPHEERLRNLSKELKLESIIEFAGYLEYDHVASLLRKCHCALNPIVPECWCAMPNKVADYFGAGLPVINSIPGELSELIRTNDAGAYYQARNAESLAAAMTEYLTHPEIAERQSPNARRVGCDLFKRETTYVEFVQFIEEL
ncbi:MAG: glycosyltransferase [Bacillota bacterium]